VEDRRRGVIPRRAWPRISAAVIAAYVAFATASGRAEPLNQRIPNLFGGSLKTGLTLIAPAEPIPNPAKQLFGPLSADLAAVLSEAPIPSPGGSFHYVFDYEADVGTRVIESLGSGFGERALTLGAQKSYVAVSYTHIGFDSVEGQRLDRLTFTEPALSQAYLAQLPQPVRISAQDDLLQTHLDLQLSMDQFFILGAYGVTDSIDVSLALSLAHVHMKAAAEADIVGPPGAVFDAKQPGVCLETVPLRCARDSFDDSAFGTGDVFLRGKWHFYDTTYADLAAAGVLTIPTGNADDFLGFHDPTFTPWLIASKHLGRFEPHLNLGYAFRTHRDVSQAEWVAGSDFRAFWWLTLNADFLGFHDDKRDGVNDDVLQSAVGFKINPIGNLVLAANFQFPLNRDGLRADVIYTEQVEYTF